MGAIINMEFLAPFLSKNAATPIATKVAPTTIAKRKSDRPSGGGACDDVDCGEGVDVGTGVGSDDEIEGLNLYFLLPSSILFQNGSLIE